MFTPYYRPRRLRRNESIRRMVRETHLRVDDLIFPLFVTEGKNVKNPIASMPGNFQMSIDLLVEEVKEVRQLGIPAIILFGIPEH
ncbi:MAG TPA: porphobilinogen synthase, partial [Caldithrix abyssi]|nr:porphobilinogen synthase [Caldithrix abyssi]